MQEIRKVNWQNDGSNVRLTMPISKVDVEKRQVSGWASLDNIDQHRDLVDAQASRDAFAEFRGNIREQHDEKRAVGRLIDFKEDTLYDPKTNKFYQGIYVTAYVSKGAQDTWEKVLDQTLSGFSIGGNVIDSHNSVDEEGNPYRKVTKYALTELSLVDNPANQLSNIISFQKSVDTGEVTITGDLADVMIENIFVCNDCLGNGHGVHKSNNETSSCPVCEAKMIKIGFVETADPDQKDTIKKMVTDYLKDREGGVKETMANKRTVVAEEEKSVQLEEVPTTEAPATETVEEVKTEEAVEVEEVVDPLTEAVSDLRALTERIEAGRAAQSEEIETLRKALEDTDARFEDRLNTLSGQISDLQGRQEDFSKRFESIDASVGEVRKGLTELDEATAIKKSVDSDQPADTKTKSFWSGSFFGTDSL